MLFRSFNCSCLAVYFKFRILSCHIFQEFREGLVKVMVTTNVAARGLDIPEVDVVIQTSPPSVSVTKIAS